MDIKEIRKARLQELINLKFGGVTARLAERIGRQASYLARILSGNPAHGRNIGEKLAREIEEACDLPYRYMDAPLDAEFFPGGTGWTWTNKTGAAEGDDPSRPETHLPDATDASLLIPKMDVRTDVGEWEQRPNFDRMISSIGLHKNWVRMNLQVSDPGNLRVITATGNSMEPMIMHGDLLLIDVGVHSFKQDGVYVLGIDGQRMVKRVQKVLDGLRILSDNRIYPEMIIPEGRRDEVVFYGRAVYAWTGTNL